MADQSISQLPVAIAPLTGNELAVVVQNGITKQTSLQNVANLGGPTGPTGPQGPTGPTGPGATVQVQSTTTTAPGTNANVVNIGSPNNVFLEFFIPRGDTGTAGATGATGPQGPAGQGVPSGGTIGQFLQKTGAGQYDTGWADVPATGITLVSGTSNQITVTNGSTSPVISIADNPQIPGTAAMRVPRGTTPQRAGVAGSDGLIRFNTDTLLFEGYSNGGWTAFALGSGVTSITAGTGLNGGTITSTGTISLANTSVTAGSYGSSSDVPTFTVNAQGQLTAAANVAITPTSIGAISAVNGTAGEIETSQVGTVVTVGIPTAPTLTGPVKVLGTGVTSITPFSTAMQVWETDINDYKEVYVRNLNNGSDASADFVAYNDASDVNSYFVDLGMNSSNFTSATYPIFTPNSGYLYTGGGLSGQQADLFIGTSNPASDIIFFTGDVQIANQRALFNGTTGNFLLNTATDTGYKLNVNGTSYFSGASLFGSTVTLNADPTLDLQAATKQYVDAKVSTGLIYHLPVQAATTTDLATTTGGTVTYNAPGPEGVGATITLSVPLLILDGYTLLNTNRVLIKDEINQAYNGVYTWATGGTVLTRATDANTYGSSPNQLSQNDYFFTQNGSVNEGTSFVVSTIGPINFTTTPITFVEFSSSKVYTGTSPIVVTGTVISLTTVPATLGGTGTATVATGDLLYGSATNTWSKLPLGIAYKSLIVNAAGNQVEWNAIPLNQTTAVSGQLNVSNGGTGASTLTGYVIGNGTSAMTASTTIPNTSITGLGTMSTQNANAVAITGGTVAGITLSTTTLGSNLDTNGYNIIGGNFGGNQLALPVGFGPFLQGLYEGNVNLRTGTTGTASAGLTLTSDGALGLGTSPSYGTSGQVLTSGGAGAAATWSTPATPVTSFQTSLSGLTPSTASTGAITLAGTLGETSGGTNQTTYTTGDILYASASNTLSKLPIGSTGQLLTVTAGAPSWVNAPASGVTSFSAGTTGFTPSTATTGAVTLAGTLAIANGGTNGTATPTAGAVPYGTGTAYAFTSAGTTGQVLTSNGAGVPTWVTPAGGVTLANDTTTATNLYPTFAAATSGSVSTIYTGNAKLLYKPLTGELQSPELVANNGLIVNSTTVSTSYTIATGNNAMSVGPITVASGATVTVSSGQRWLVL